MPASGHNEGFRVLEEFSCEAIPPSDAGTPRSGGRGVNTGVNVLTELMVRASYGPVTQDQNRVNP